MIFGEKESRCVMGTYTCSRQAFESARMEASTKGRQRGAGHRTYDLHVDGQAFQVDDGYVCLSWGNHLRYVGRTRLVAASQHVGGGCGTLGWSSTCTCSITRVTFRLGDGCDDDDLVCFGGDEEWLGREPVCSRRWGGRLIDCSRITHVRDRMLRSIMRLASMRPSLFGDQLRLALSFIIM